MMNPNQLWQGLISDDDAGRVADARFGRRVGYGQRPALLVIDAQRYMVGEPGSGDGEYPSACPDGPAAVDRIAALAAAARTAGAPVIFTRFVLRGDGSDAGVYARKRDILDIDTWCIEGTRGAELAAELAPGAGDVVLDKKKPSAFHGTPLLGLLIERGVDTLVVTGGSTSNCVRATVVDAASHNFRTHVPHDAVFDRVDVSHRIALYDIDRQYGDVTSTDDVLAYLAGSSGASPPPR